MIGAIAYYVDIEAIQAIIDRKANTSILTSSNKLVNDIPATKTSSSHYKKVQTQAQARAQAQAQAQDQALI